jgi:hypothetical protein
MSPAKKKQQVAKSASTSLRGTTPKLYRSMGQIRRAFYPQVEEGTERESSGKHTHMVGFPVEDTSPEDRGRLQA